MMQETKINAMGCDVYIHRVKNGESVEGFSIAIYKRNTRRDTPVVYKHTGKHFSSLTLDMLGEIYALPYGETKRILWAVYCELHRFEEKILRQLDAALEQPTY